GDCSRCGRVFRTYGGSFRWTLIGKNMRYALRRSVSVSLFTSLPRRSTGNSVLLSGNEAFSLCSQVVQVGARDAAGEVREPEGRCVEEALPRVRIHPWFAFGRHSVSEPGNLRRYRFGNLIFCVRADRCEAGLHLCLGTAVYVDIFRRSEVSEHAIQPADT